MDENAPTGARGQLHLVLWDVDHTLIETRGVGGEIFANVFQQVTKVPMGEMAPLEGRTEPVIVAETLKLQGITPTDELLEAFFDALADAYDAGHDRLRVRGRALPGAPEALQELAAWDGIAQSVLTGNLRRVAITKLETFGLAGFMDFDIGAYGSDDPDRLNLVRVARERLAKKHDLPVGPDMVTVIGDTPNDIRAGLANQTHVIGIASGRYTAEELANAGAGRVLADLHEVPNVVEEQLRRSGRGPGT